MRFDLWPGSQWTTRLPCKAARRQGRTNRHGRIHLGVSKALGSGTRGFAELNAASGGGDADTVRTFDNLYPTNHNKYGISDLQGWRNMNELAVGVEFTPVKDAKLTASYRILRLADARDAWYGAGGAPNKRAGGVYVDPTGASGRNVGAEWNLDASYKLSSLWTVNGGLAVFTPGGFVKSVNGGHGDQQTWGYLQLSAKF